MYFPLFKPLVDISFLIIELKKIDLKKSLNENIYRSDLIVWSEQNLKYFVRWEKFWCFKHPMWMGHLQMKSVSISKFHLKNVTTPMVSKVGKVTLLFQCIFVQNLKQISLCWKTRTAIAFWFPIDNSITVVWNIWFKFWSEARNVGGIAKTSNKDYFKK